MSWHVTVCLLWGSDVTPSVKMSSCKISWHGINIYPAHQPMSGQFQRLSWTRRMDHFIQDKHQTEFCSRWCSLPISWRATTKFFLIVNDNKDTIKFQILVWHHKLRFLSDLYVRIFMGSYLTCWRNGSLVFVGYHFCGSYIIASPQRLEQLGAIKCLLEIKWNRFLSFGLCMEELAFPWSLTLKFNKTLKLS